MKRIFVIKRAEVKGAVKDTELAQFSYEEDNKQEAKMNLWSAVSFMDGYIQAMVDNMAHQYWEQSSRRGSDGFVYWKHNDLSTTISVMIDYEGNDTGRVAKYSDFE